MVLASVQNFCYYGIIIWLPSYLGTRFHYSFNKSGVWTAVTVCGMVIGVYVFGKFADRVGRRPTFLIFQIGAALAVWGTPSCRTPRRCCSAAPSWACSSTA